MSTDEFYVVYDQTTGAERWRSQGPRGAAAAQQLAPGLAAAVVPVAAITGEAIHLDLVRTFYCNLIDAGAEQLRGQFATPGSGQAMEYQEAVAQARALIGGAAGPHPMLTADVTAGTIDPRTNEAVTTEAEAADLILWMHVQWVSVGSSIRELRLAAKVAIKTAANIGGIVTAAQVDWAAITA